MPEKTGSALPLEAVERAFSRFEYRGMSSLVDETGLSDIAIAKILESLGGELLVNYHKGGQRIIGRYKARDDGASDELVLEASE